MTSGGQATIPTHDWSFLQGGGEMGALMRAKDWTHNTLGPPAGWPQSLRTTLSILLGSKVPMFLFWGQDLICFYNDAYRPSLGNEGKHPEILGQKGEEGWVEIWTIIKPLIDQVMAGGEASWNEDQLIPIYRNGAIENVWWTFSYSPVNDESGCVAGVFVTCFETTDKVRNMGAMQASDQRFQNLIREASVGIIVLSGEEIRVEVVNEAYGQLIDRTPGELLGRPLFDIIPHAEQPFRQLLDKVRLTGESIYLYGHPYLVYTNGRKIEGFLDVVYQPYKEADGTITGVIALVHNVTERTLFGKKIEEAELKARLAIDSADLGTYEIDLTTDGMITSDRFNAICGIPGSLRRQEIVARIHPEDREMRLRAHERSLSSGFIDYETRVIWDDRSEHWVKVKGKVLYDEKRNPITLLGVVQDITEHKHFTEQLTKQVNERTLELQRSNDDLMQFAHVISHDLKEPVRKIRIFGDRISDEMEDTLPERAGRYLTKIKNSANRMTDMIEGVLKYSSLSSSREAVSSIDLNETIRNIRIELEILIQQKQARIIFKDLPVIPGAAVLLYQLFYNLINNSLKFSRADTPPVITISSIQIMVGNEAFSEITVADNGIGFDQEHADSIFTSFFRLNSKDQYEGTGLGLALSKKIAERHGGTIAASSTPGKGANIVVRLPYHKITS